MQKYKIKDCFKDILFAFVMSLLIVTATIGGTWWARSYANGKKAAEIAFADTRAEIEKNAIERYKASQDFKKDSTLYVAENIELLTTLEILYQEIPKATQKKMGLSNSLEFYHNEYNKYKKK